VIRGDDHIENTYRHVALYRALNADVPAYAHLPMIVNGQGKPYSKRDGDAYVGDFRDKGVHPAALFNTLSLLGWSPGDDREKMTRAEAVSLFSLDRIKSGPAQMDMKKLTHLNGLYIGELSLAAFMSDIKGFLPDPAWALDGDFFSRVCALMQSRTRLYTDVRDWAYFFCEDFEYEEKAVRKQLMKEGSRAALSDLRGRLQDSEFGEDAIERVIHETEREMAIPEGKLNLPIRVAVTGISRGAGIYETLALLGRARSLQRLDRAVADLCGGDA